MKRLKRYIKKLFNIIKKPEMNYLPGNMAFNLVLALIPILMLTVYIASLFSVSIDSVIHLLEDILPSKISSTVIEVISGRGFDKGLGFLNVITFIIATNGAYTIITTSDALYKVKESDEIKKRIKSVFILTIIVLLFIFLILVPLFGEKILGLLHSLKIFDKLIDELIFMFNLLKWPVTAFIIFFNIKFIYTFAPSKQMRSTFTNYGAIFTTIIWIIATVIFGYYLNYFARYDVIYGNLSTLVMLMVWLYVLSYVFVLGIAINVTKYNDFKDKIEESVNDNNGI